MTSSSPESKPAKRSKSMTATADNAMSEAEREAFLSTAKLIRIGSIRPDSAPHVTPAWFLWEDGQFIVPMPEVRVQVQNIRRGSKVAVLVDVDQRPELGPDADVRGVLCRGPVRLESEPAFLKDVIVRLGKKYGLPARSDAELLALVPGRVAMVLKPTSWLTWDFSHG